MTSAASTSPDTPHGPCIFCAIASKKIPARIVHEDDDFVAFLDINPIRPGHVLIVSREHHAYFDHLPPPLAARMMQLGQRFSRAMKRIHEVERIGFLFTGTDVAHVHAHLVPLVNDTDITSPVYIEQKDLRFVRAPRASDDELATQSDRLLQELGPT